MHLLRTSIRSVRHYTVVRAAHPSAPRECPTPLLFVSASKWDPNSVKGIDALTQLLSLKGFSCVHSDVSTASSKDLMQHFVDELKSDLRLSGHGSLFPPVLFARSAASLIAQTYISSNPVSAMMLMGDVPTSNAASRELLPSPLEEFNYELTFPIALLTTPSWMERLERGKNRIATEASVARYTAEDLESHEAFEKIENWLDRLGI